MPGNDFRVILRYGQLRANGIATSYTIEHPDPVCTSATPPSRLSAINTPLGSTAMDVMEEAVRENGRSYRFSTEYVLFIIGVDGVSEQSYGHVVRQIGDVAENNSCYWAMFVTPPNGAESKINTPVSAFTLPGDDYTLTLRYLELQAPTSDSTATRSGTKVHTLCCTATLLAIWCALNGNETLHSKFTISIYYLEARVHCTTCCKHSRPYPFTPNQPLYSWLFLACVRHLCIQMNEWMLARLLVGLVRVYCTNLGSWWALFTIPFPIITAPHDSRPHCDGNHSGDNATILQHIKTDIL